MALQLKLALLQHGGCRAFSLFEKTGIFDAVSNPTGYGSPNPDVGDVSSAVIQITLPDESVVSLNITGDFGAIFPTTDDTDQLEITNEILGLSEDENLPYGIYTFVYTIFAEDGSIIAQGTFKFLIDCTLFCCLDNLLATLDECDCCSDPAAKMKNWRVRAGYIYLQAAQAAFGCGKTQRAKALLDFVNDICAQTKCNCN